jgi:hypothetical protein
MSGEKDGMQGSLSENRDGEKTHAESAEYAEPGDGF